MKKSELRKIIRELIEKQFYTPPKGSGGIDECSFTRHNECPEYMCCDGCNCYPSTDATFNSPTGPSPYGYPGSCGPDIKTPDVKIQ